MGYLGLDIDNAGDLAARLRSDALKANDAQGRIIEAALLADLVAPCALELDELAADFEFLAGQIEWAIVLVAGLGLRLTGLTDWSVLPAPVRTPVALNNTVSLPLPLEGSPGHRVGPLWDARADSQWNEVHQTASHNSYAVVGGVERLFDQGVRTFELDIHRHRPEHLIAPLLAGSWLAGLVRAEESVMATWHVYHATGWTYSEYGSLAQGLAAIAGLETDDPLTVFVDNKDRFGGVHTVDAFDDLLRSELGDRLFAPADLRLRSPRAASLLEAVQSDGWPSVNELQGRILVVITDDIDGYVGDERRAFVAAAPEFTTLASPVVHDPEPELIFYNVDAHQVSAEEIVAVQATSTVLRTYFNPVCPSRFQGELWAHANYHAVDVAVDGQTCGPAVLQPPVRVSTPHDGDDAVSGLDDVE